MCCKCNAQRGVDIQECYVHGPVLHRYDVCAPCKEGRDPSRGTCATHGAAPSVAGSCERCAHHDLDMVAAGGDVTLETLKALVTSCESGAALKLMERHYGISRYRVKNLLKAAGAALR